MGHTRTWIFLHHKFNNPYQFTEWALCFVKCEKSIFMFCWPCISIHLCNKTNLMRYLSSVYFVNQILHVSGINVAHHQEVYCICKTIGTCCAFSWLSVGRSANRLSTESTKLTNCCIYSILPDDGLQVCPKHVEVDWRNKLRIKSASIWFFVKTGEKANEQNVWGQGPIVLPITELYFLAGCYFKKKCSFVIWQWQRSKFCS